MSEMKLWLSFFHFFWRNWIKIFILRERESKKRKIIPFLNIVLPCYRSVKTALNNEFPLYNENRLLCMNPAWSTIQELDHHSPSGAIENKLSGVLPAGPKSKRHSGSTKATYGKFFCLSQFVNTKSRNSK